MKKAPYKKVLKSIILCSPQPQANYYIAPSEKGNNQTTFAIFPKKKHLAFNKVL